MRVVPFVWGGDLLPTPLFVSSWKWCGFFSKVEILDTQIHIKNPVGLNLVQVTGTQTWREGGREGTFFLSPS